VKGQLCAMAVALAFAAACAYHPKAYPINWKLYGEVLAASDTRFQVQHKSGHHVDLLIDDETVFEKDHQPATWHSLLHWSRVVVDVETFQDGTAHARHVHISGGDPW